MAVERQVRQVLRDYKGTPQIGVTIGGLTVRMWRGDVELTDKEVNDTLGGLTMLGCGMGGLAGLAVGVGGTLLIQRIAR